MTDPHEDLVEAVARKIYGTEVTAWPSDQVREREIIRARSVIALIAERTKDATPEMAEASGIPVFHGRAVWLDMHRASALWPKEKS